MSPLCPSRDEQRLTELAATTAATATAFTFFAIAVVVVDYVQLVHGFHLLSNRRLSMN